MRSPCCRPIFSRRPLGPRPVLPESSRPGRRAFPESRRHPSVGPLQTRLALQSTALRAEAHFHGTAPKSLGELPSTREIAPLQGRLGRTKHGVVGPRVVRKFLGHLDEPRLGFRRPLLPFKRLGPPELQGRSGWALRISLECNSNRRRRLHRGACSRARSSPARARCEVQAIPAPLQPVAATVPPLRPSGQAPPTANPR